MVKVKPGEAADCRGQLVLFVPHSTHALTVFNNLHQVSEMGQDGTSHQNSNLLHDLDSSMTCLPGFLTLTHRLQEGQQWRCPEGRCHHSESSGRRVTNVFVDVVDIRPHSRDHGSETSSLCEIGDDFSTFYACVVIFVDQQRFDNHKDLKSEGIWNALIDVLKIANRKKK